MPKASRKNIQNKWQNFFPKKISIRSIHFAIAYFNAIFQSKHSYNFSLYLVLSGQKTPGLTKNAYHPISYYEKNDYRTISHYFIDQKNTKKIAW